jgi:hypothetical protein
MIAVDVQERVNAGARVGQAIIDVGSASCLSQEDVHKIYYAALGEGTVNSRGEDVKGVKLKATVALRRLGTG